MGYRFGFDIGGTFTDFVMIDADSGRTVSYKTLTTPDARTWEGSFGQPVIEATG